MTDTDWIEIESPVDAALSGVVETVTGPWAVGTDGVVVGRIGDETAVRIPAGPGAAANTLTDVTATDDGTRIWFAGASGSLGAYDVTDRRKYDYSAPGEKTSTWEAVAAAGDGDGECLLVANGSGEVAPATVDADGCPRFGPVVKPGGGASITAVDVGGGRAYAVDTSGEVYATALDGAWLDPAGTHDEPLDAAVRPDGGAKTPSQTRRGGAVELADRDESSPADRDESSPADRDEPSPADRDEPSPAAGSEDPDLDSDDEHDRSRNGWRRIGIPNAEVDFRDVAADGDRLFVAGDDGLVFRYDRPCRNWTPVAVADGDLHGIDVVGDAAVAVGDEGTVARRTDDSDWWRQDAPVEETLTDVAFGTRAYAVGREGTIVEGGIDG